jgi:hypothetical protein
VGSGGHPREADQAGQRGEWHAQRGRLQGPRRRRRRRWPRARSETTSRWECVRRRAPAAPAPTTAWAAGSTAWPPDWRSGWWRPGWSALGLRRGAPAASRSGRVGPRCPPRVWSSRPGRSAWAWPSRARGLWVSATAS